MDTEIEHSWVLIDSLSPKKNELDWLLDELYETLANLKHGLEDCYALLAPVDPGSTLVLSTPRNEVVKGHITRVGTRIVKGVCLPSTPSLLPLVRSPASLGCRRRHRKSTTNLSSPQTINIRLRTLSQQTLTINPDHPIHLGSLTSLHSLLTNSIDLLGLTLSFSYPDKTPSPSSSTTIGPPAGPPIHSSSFLAAQLRLLAQYLAEASSLLKGPPLTISDPAWTTRSSGPAHFNTSGSASNPISPVSSGGGGIGGSSGSGGSGSGVTECPQLSFYLGIQDGSLVLWLRSLEPADVPMNFGTKLALAIGTTRRLEHDEADRVFGFCLGRGADDDDEGWDETSAAPAPAAAAHGNKGGKEAKASSSIRSGKRDTVDVYVREKVRVESADPSLLSLSAKLSALSHALGVARRNLAAVMGEEEPEDY